MLLDSMLLRQNMVSVKLKQVRLQEEGKMSQMITIIYVSDDDARHAFKARTRSNDNMRIGSVRGFGEDGYIDKLIGAVKNNKSINALIIDFASMELEYSRDKAAKYVIRIISSLKHDDTLHIYIVDKGTAFNDKGRRTLEAYGAQILQSDSATITALEADFEDEGNEADENEHGENDNADDDDDDSQERLPGMRADTPVNIVRENQDPFADVDDDDSDIFESLAPFDNDENMPIDNSRDQAESVFDDIDDMALSSNDESTSLSDMQSSEDTRQKDNADTSDDPFVALGLVDDDSEDDPFADLNDDDNNDSITRDYAETNSEHDDAFDTDDEGNVLTGNDDDKHDLFDSILDIDNAEQKKSNNRSSDVNDDNDIFATIPDDRELQSLLDDVSSESFDYNDDIIDDASDEPITLDDLLREYGNRLNDSDYRKLRTMVEPDFDYSLEHDDGIGKKKLSSSLGLSSSSLNGVSQVDSSKMANSTYIMEKREQDGYYDPGTDCKVISCWSCKGGSGKTSIATMLAVQLNWYFNPDLMQKQSPNVRYRILMMSFNEFDDLPVQGIGYTSSFSEEEENDGHNVYELLQRIDDANGDPSWGDVSDCFVTNPRNMIYYLPSLTQKESNELGYIMSADDYEKIISVCTKFFSYIIIDSPDTFYDNRGDLMSFAFTSADVIVFIIEPDARSTRNLTHFFFGISDDDGNIPLDPGKCMLVVNKYVSNGNPYMPVKPVGQIKYESITKNMRGYFSRFVCMPYTRVLGSGNIMTDGTDMKVKLASAEIADDVLELIDEQRAKEESKKHNPHHAGRRRSLSS